MFNKEVCKKCLGEGWEEEDEENWKNGKIWCILEWEKIYFITTDKVPKRCPYYLEHIVNDI